MEKDKLWIDKILAAGNELRSLQAPDHLFEKIQEAKNRPELHLQALSIYQLRAALVAAIIFAVLNIGVLFYASSQPKVTQSAYSIDDHNFNIY